MSIIIAGIIDTRTGKISDTVTRPQEKTALRLKVRDELNVEHGKDTFMAFELDTALGFNFTFLRNKMQTTDPQATAELELLHARYQHHRTTELLANKKAELATCEDAMDKCLALFPQGSTANEFIDNGLSDALVELRNDIDSCSHRLRQWETKVQALSK